MFVNKLSLNFLNNDLIWKQKKYKRYSLYLTHLRGIVCIIDKQINIEMNKLFVEKESKQFFILLHKFTRLYTNV